jgi:hypothetical protein
MGSGLAPWPRGQYRDRVHAGDTSCTNRHHSSTDGHRRAADADGGPDCHGAPSPQPDGGIHEPNS